jgi:hypothetical protein
VTIGREAVHPRVPIAIGDIQVTRRVRDELRGIVEGASRAGHQVPWPLTARVRMDAMTPQHLNGLAVQGVYKAH